MSLSLRRQALGLRERKSAAEGHKIWAQWKQHSCHVLRCPCLRPGANHCPPGTGKPPSQLLAICYKIKVVFEVGD